MAYTWDIDEKESVELPEFMSYVEEYGNPEDEDSFIDCRVMLRRLANNRKFVLDRYHDNLRLYAASGEQALSQTQSIELSKAGKFYLRANIWLPIDESSLTSFYQKKLFSYDLPHDHNFSFLTVGYFGEGYETDIYSYDFRSAVGYHNERVAMDFLGRHKLSPGRLMFYRGGRDIHIQYCPETLSVSLNLMPNIKHVPEEQQYIFDCNAKSIVGGAGDLISNKLFLFKAAGFIGDDSTVELLGDIAKSEKSCPKTRAMALRSVEQIDHAASEHIKRSVPMKVIELYQRDLVCGSKGRDYMA